MRRGPLFGVIVACAALAACLATVLVAVLWRGESRDEARGSLANEQALALADGEHATAAAVAPEAALRIQDLNIPGPGLQMAASLEDAVINRSGSAEVPVRRYDSLDAAGNEAEPWAVLVWAHGGSFVHGGLDMIEADWVARQFAVAGMRVYSVDYVLASDTVKAPAPANDVAAVAGWVGQHESAPLVIGGASAGAHLAVLAAVDQAEAANAGDARAAAALLLEYPTLHRVQRPDAAIANATAGLGAQLRFDPDRVSAMYATHLGELPETEVTGRGLVAGELPRARLALLPPTVIVNAEADDLRASGEEFAEQLAMVGVRVIEYTEPGTAHGYLNRATDSAAAAVTAQLTIDRLVAEARASLAG